MEEINPNVGGSPQDAGGLVNGWPTGTTTSQDGTAGLFGLAGTDNQYLDLLLNADNPYSDSTTSTSGYFVYVTESGVPVLYPPSADDNPLISNTLNNLITPEVLNESLESYLTSYADTTTASSADYSKYEGITVTDPEIIALAEAEGVPPGVVYANVTMTQAFIFNQQLADLPDDVAQKLQYAYYVQGAADNLDPSLKATYDSIMANVNQSIQQSFGFSASWKAVEPQTDAYMQGVNIEYDSLVEQGLNDAVANGTITEEEAAALRSLHYNPDTESALSPTLKTILSNIEAQSIQTLQSKYGFSSTWQPVPDVASYTAILNGDYVQNYISLVQNYTGDDISEEDQALLTAYANNPNDPSIPDRIKQLAAEITDKRSQLLKYFDNPDDPSIPDDIKAIGEQLKAQATSATVAKYGLSSDWAPTVTSLYAAGVDPTTILKAQSAIDTMKDIFHAAEARVNAMPDSPEKAVYLNYLKQIGLAIQSLQEAIYLIQNANTDASKRAGAAKLDSALEDLQQQQNAADAVKEKQDKMGDTGCMSKVFDFLMTIMIAVVGICMGPFGALLSLFYLADKAQQEARGTDSTLTQQMFAKISDACGPAGGAVVNYMLVMAFTMLSCNVMLTINTFTQDSKIVQNVVEAMGGDEMAQEITNMVVTVIIQIAMMVFMFLISGPAAGAQVAQTITRVAQLVGTSVEKAARIVRIANLAQNAIMAALQAAPSGVSLNNNILLSEIDMIKGRSESMSTEIQALIQLLQDMVNKLLSTLNSNADWITDISDFQGKKWDDASGVLTNAMRG